MWTSYSYILVFLSTTNIILLTHNGCNAQLKIHYKDFYQPNFNLPNKFYMNNGDVPQDKPGVRNFIALEPRQEGSQTPQSTNNMNAPKRSPSNQQNNPQTNSQNMLTPPRGSPPNQTNSPKSSSPMSPESMPPLQQPQSQNSKRPASDTPQGPSLSNPQGFLTNSPLGPAPTNTNSNNGQVTTIPLWQFALGSMRGNRYTLAYNNGNIGSAMAMAPNNNVGNPSGASPKQPPPQQLMSNQRTPQNNVPPQGQNGQPQQLQQPSQNGMISPQSNMQIQPLQMQWTYTPSIMSRLAAFYSARNSAA